MRTSPAHEQKLVHLSAHIITFIAEVESNARNATLRSTRSTTMAQSKQVADTLYTIRVSYKDRFQSLRTLDDFASIIALLDAQTQSGLLHPDGVKIVLNYMKQAL